MRGFRDRDYLQTEEGYFFCVVGPLHPEDRVIAYLKYVPDPSGKWGSGKKRFARALRYYTMLDLLETLHLLEGHPEYLHNSPVLGISMSAVPVDRISTHLKPEIKLSQLKRMRSLDTLQRKAVDLATLISEESRCTIEYFGVTGSLLLDIHQDFSDIDLIVYGRDTCQAVKGTLTRIYDEKSMIRRFDEGRSREWCLNKARMYPVTYEEAARILAKKWGRGLFGETMFSVHPAKLEEEVSEKYGDRIFKPEGTVKIEAVVSDAAEAGFMPAVYKVEDVRILEGPSIEDIREVTSYEGLYGDIGESEDRIVAYGKLERVANPETGEEYHRVLIGSPEVQGRDYIKI